jgi:regulator of protease activity HflC (stomatin/prohibitin superfamily)
MLWFSSLILAAIAVLAIIVFVPKKTSVRKAAFIGVGILVAVVTIASSVKPIPAGEVGVVYRFGEIVGQKSEGIAVVAPWEKIHKANIRTQRQTFSQVTAASAETQDVFLQITVNYSLSANAVQDLFRDVGTNWFDVLVPSRVANYTKAETAKYKTVDIIPQRESIRRAIRDRIAADLEPYSITISDLLIDNIDFMPSFKEAIESKQVQTETAKREQEKVAEEEAKADQARARAQGESDAAIIRAEGVAESNRLISESLTPAVLQYQAIEKLAGNVQIALIPSGQGFILDPSSILAPPSGDGK